jgi:serine/threonine protein kinase
MPETLSVEAIFHAALAFESADQQAAFLEGACANQPELRRRVDALLRRREAQGPLDRPVSRHFGGAPEILNERPGAVIGPYKLLEEIGAGGFGVVFMAEQLEPVSRKVALKVIKPGMDSRQVIARFEAERQALALMDHPNIARILDGGQTTGGLPYFVMDLVKGVPITDFCDQGRLAPRERLELFSQVCRAVQHAHQRGIIHRDIKPSNVLVTLHDGTPLVKVIDFGIAKALGGQLTAATLFTGFGQMLGTPLYMPPEQAALSDVEVDTRGDIYSLGVLLYELLTGTTPFEKERLLEAGYDEMRRILREEEPPPPSSRLSTLGNKASTIATQRGSEPRRLTQMVRGELDWIVMKCLDKDRNRRNGEVHQLLGVTLWMDNKPAEAVVALQRASVLDPKEPAPYWVLGTVFTSQRMLREAAQAYRKFVDLKPDEAGGHTKLGIILAELKQLPAAEASLKKALELKPDDAEARVNLASVLKSQGKLVAPGPAAKETAVAKRKEAGAHYMRAGLLNIQFKWPEAIEAYRKAIELRPDFAEAYNDLACTINTPGRHRKMPDAVAALRKALELRPGDANMLQNLAVMLAADDKWSEAETVSRAALKLQPDRVQVLIFLGTILQRQGKFADALTALKQASGLKTQGNELPALILQAEQFVLFDGKLPEILAGEFKPADAAERLALAKFCDLRCRKLFAASTRFYGQAFAAVPDLEVDNRYDAACVAALAGTGQGQDAVGLASDERARLRSEALAWLRADLAARREKERTRISGIPLYFWMQSWQQDADFNGVRGAEALARLPESERREWQELWREINELAEPRSASK